MLSKKHTQPGWQLPLIILGLLGFCCCASPVYGQDDDPTSPSENLTETLDKIRRIEELNVLKSERDQLAKRNKELAKQVDELSKQLQELQKNVTTLSEIQKEYDELKRKTAVLPRLEVQSIAVGVDTTVATMLIEDQKVYIRPNSRRTIRLDNGQQLRMEVREINSFEVLIEFPDIERDLVLTP